MPTLLHKSSLALPVFRSVQKRLGAASTTTRSIDDLSNELLIYVFQFVVALNREGPPSGLAPMGHGRSKLLASVQSPPFAADGGTSRWTTHPVSTARSATNSIYAPNWSPQNDFSTLTHLHIESCRLLADPRIIPFCDFLRSTPTQPHSSLRRGASVPLRPSTGPGPGCTCVAAQAALTHHHLRALRHGDRARHFSGLTEARGGMAAPP